MRGLWQRNGRFFANLTVADDIGAKTSRMVPLNGATLSEAMDDYRKLQVERTEDRLCPLGQTPMLSDYITTAFTPQLRASGNRATSGDSLRAEQRSAPQQQGEPGTCTAE